MEEALHAKVNAGYTAEVGSDLESSIQSHKADGQALSISTRNFFEPRFGYDFGQVRVHSNASAEHICNQLGARAFTLGKEVFFQRNSYNPNSAEGKRLLGHELTHIVQQSAAPAKKSNSLVKKEVLSGFKKKERNLDNDNLIISQGQMNRVMTLREETVLRKEEASSVQQHTGNTYGVNSGMTGEQIQDAFYRSFFNHQVNVINNATISAARGEIENARDGCLEALSFLGYFLQMFMVFAIETEYDEQAYNLREEMEYLVSEMNLIILDQIVTNDDINDFISIFQDVRGMQWELYLSLQRRHHGQHAFDDRRARGWSR